MKRFFSFLALLVACSSSTATTNPQAAPPDDTTDAGGGGDQDAGAPSGGQPRSCDPLTPRDPAPKLLIGPTDFEKAVVAELDAAATSIEILIYEIDRKSVIDALVAAKKRGVDVKLVVDRNESAPAKATLKAAGIDVKDSPAEFTYAHAKSIVIDGKRAIVLSGNLNDYTFDGERNYAVVDDDPSDVADVHAVFARDFAGSGDVDVSCTKLLVAPLNARERITSLIEGAKAKLDLTVMYVTDKDLVAALKERHAAGVALRVLLANPSWISSNTGTAADLKAAGIEVKYYEKLDLHAKMVVADDTAFIGSENLSANSLDNNRELGVFSTEPEVVTRIQAQVDEDWAAGVAP